MTQSDGPFNATAESKSISLNAAPDHQVEVFSSVNEVPVAVWNQCLEESNLFLSLNYLGAAERSALPGMQFRYAVIRSGDTPVAVLYFQVVNLSDAGLGGILNLEEYGGLAGSLSTRINDILFSPGKNKESCILVCGNLLVSGEHGVAAVNDEEFKLAIEAINPIKKVIAHSLPSHTRLVAFMVKDFFGHLNTIARPILKKDYFLLNTDPEMIFDVRPEWKHFDDYKAALSSKYRVRTNSVLNKLGEVIIKELSIDEIVNAGNEIFQLNDNVIKKAPVKLARPSESYFINLKKIYGHHYRINGFFLNNKMIAFTSGLWNEAHFEAHYIGLDYQFNQQYCLYQNILYSYIKDAIECRSEKLFFGRTALEIKSTTGARPHDLSCYFRFANRVLNTLAKPLVSSTGPKEWIPRDPFKSTAE